MADAYHHHRAGNGGCVIGGALSREGCVAASAPPELSFSRSVREDGRVAAAQARPGGRVQRSNADAQAPPPTTRAAAEDATAVGTPCPGRRAPKKPQRIPSPTKRSPRHAPPTTNDPWRGAPPQSPAWRRSRWGQGIPAGSHEKTHASGQQRPCLSADHLIFPPTRARGCCAAPHGKHRGFLYLTVWPIPALEAHTDVTLAAAAACGGGLAAWVGGGRGVGAAAAGQDSAAASQKVHIDLSSPPPALPPPPPTLARRKGVWARESRHRAPLVS